MSSNPPADRPSRRPVSLRAKLTLQLVLVVAIVCVIITVATEFALHTFLIRRLDQQLTEASFRAGGPGPEPGGGPGPGPGHGPRGRPIEASGQGSGTVIATLVGDTVRDAQRLNSSGQPENLPITAYPALRSLPVDGKPTNRDLGDLGEYRLVATRAEDGDIVIAGLPLSSVDETQRTVGWILGGVSLIALVVAFGAGTVIVRRTLRPLQRVAATAGKVVELPLDRGEVPLSVRVPESDTD